MISFNKIEYSIEENPKQVFTRLTWAVESRDRIWWLVANGRTSATHKNWIGILDNEKLRFTLLKSGNSWIPRFIQFIIRGKINGDEDTSNVEIKIRPGWITLIISILMFISALLQIIGTAVAGNLSDVAGLLGFLLLPFIWFLFIYLRLKDLNKNLDELFY